MTMWITIAEDERLRAPNVPRGNEGQQGQRPTHESLLHDSTRDKAC